MAADVDKRTQLLDLRHRQFQHVLPALQRQSQPKGEEAACQRRSGAEEPVSPTLEVRHRTLRLLHTLPIGLMVSTRQE